MKYLILCLLFFCQGAFAGEWYEGSWIYDAALTEKQNPTMPAASMREVKASFDKFAGKITVNSRRIKCKRAKLGVPYRVVGKGRSAVVLEAKGPAIEMVKAFNPDLKKQSLRSKVVRISSNVISFEVQELQTIRMYLRRVQ